MIEGLHHNYLQVPLADPHLTKIAHGSDSFSIADYFTSSRAGGELFAMSAYAPYPALALRIHISGPRRPQIEFPKVLSQQRQLHSERKQILERFLSPPSVLRMRGISTRLVVTEMISHLLDTLAPHIQSSAFHLLNVTERKSAARVIDTMISLGCTFVPVRSAYGLSSQTLLYRLDPDIEALCTFNLSTALADYGYGIHGASGFFARNTRVTGTIGKPSTIMTPGSTGAGGYAMARGSSGRRDLSSMVKEALAREIAFEIIRRTEKRLTLEDGDGDIEAGHGSGLDSWSEQSLGEMSDSTTSTTAGPSSTTTAVTATVTKNPSSKMAQPSTVPVSTGYHISPAVAAAQRAAAAKQAAAARLGKDEVVGGQEGEQKQDTEAPKGRAPGIRGFFTSSGRHKNKRADGDEDGSSGNESLNSGKSRSVIASDREERAKHALHYQFQEGFSNAVRRPVSMRTFL